MVMVICLEQGADCLRMVHCIPKHHLLLLHLNPDCLPYPGCLGKEVVGVCVTVDCSSTV